MKTQIRKQGENLIKKIKKRLLEWLDGASFLPLFISMSIVKLLDVAFAYATYLIRPSLFMAREANQLLLNAIAYGKIFPFLLVEVLIYIQLGAIAAGLAKVREYKGKFFSLAFGIPLISLGFLTLCLYPVSMGSNIINGLLALDVIRPISVLFYTATGFPIGWIAARYGWKFKNPYIIPCMLVVMLVMGFQI